MRPRVCLLASAVLILLIDAPPSPAATAESVDLASVDACSLLTQAEMSAAVGAPMDSGKHPFSASNAFCSWQRPPGAPTMGLAPRAVQVWLSVTPFDERTFEQQKGPAAPTSATSVAGLGDEAYYVQDKVMNFLQVRRGSIEVRITIMGYATTDQQSVLDSERTIAAQVLSEL
jgi:hypothetical protein